MVKFRQKDFSIKSRTIKGAMLGAQLGGLSSAVLPSNATIPTKIPGSNTFNNTNKAGKSLMVVAAATLVGASLGALTGMLEKGNDKLSGRNVSNRLLETVVSYLKKDSFRDGVDFTRDPKKADELRTKVCIVVTKNSGSLRVLINTQMDSKLRDLTRDITENIPNSSVEVKQASNKYNEIVVSTISDGSADAGLITGICNRFIREGYPVYLIEVGI